MLLSGGVPWSFFLIYQSIVSRIAEVEAWTMDLRDTSRYNKSCVSLAFIVFSLSLRFCEAFVIMF